MPHIELAWLNDLWQIPSVKAAVVTIVISILLDLGRRFFVPKGKVAWGVSHNEHFILPAQPPEQPAAINVLTRQIFIQNVGRAMAEDIEITINFSPQHWHAFPPLVEVMESGQDRFLRFHTDILNKRESFIISLFEARQGSSILPDVLTVRWKGGVAKQVRMVPRQKLPDWIERGFLLVFYFGILSIVFLISRFILINLIG